VTYIPIPEGARDNFAGLFTVDLPPPVVVGRGSTSWRAASVNEASRSRYLCWSGGDTRRGRRALATAEVDAKATGVSAHAERNWRYVVGALQVRIPVTAAEMPPQDENVFAIFKRRLEQMHESSRWHPVLKSMVSYLSSRVAGLGGDPNTIRPSPGGIPLDITPHYHPKLESEVTGKVCEVLYDCFGV